jgi:hypothetical protein
MIREVATHIINGNNATGRIKLTLSDKDGNVLQSGTVKMDSLVIQYWTFMYNIARNVGGNVLDYDAGGQTVNSTNGIIVGTSATAVTYQQTGLVARINNSAGLLAASAMVTTYDGASGTGTLYRTFTNNTASTTYTVQEIGAAIQIGNFTGNPNNFIIRDLTGIPYAVMPTNVLTVEYEIHLEMGAQNFPAMFLGHFVTRNIANMTLYDPSGTLVTGSFSANNNNFNFLGLYGDSDRGIIVGTSNANADAFATFVVDGKVSNGTNSGELVYLETKYTSKLDRTGSSNGSDFYFTRTVHNLSGSDIIVNRMALCSNVTINSANTVYTFDSRVIDPITISNATFATFNWKIQYDFS